MSSGAEPAQSSKSPVIRVFDCHVARPTRDGRYEYLLLQRADHKIYAGSWRMVGGKLKPNETAWQACLRELHEETSLPVQRLLTVPYINRFYEWSHDRINDIPVFVAVTSAGAEPVLDEEHSAASWLALSDALARMPWPGQREGLRAAEDLLTSNPTLQGFLEVELPR